MLENCKSAKERWGGVSDIIDHWLQQRQDLIVTYCTISGVHEHRQSTPSNATNNLRHFCQLLVDYVSAGHFEVYDHLLLEAEAFNDGKGLEVARRLYPHISRTTELVLAFNDKYDTETTCHKGLVALAPDLSALGETLVSRFELEDQLVENLHNAHEELVA